MSDESRCATDWFRVICDANKEGYSLEAIALIIKVPKPTIIGWKQGSEPKHSDGERLLALWFSATGKTREQAPKAIKLSAHFKAWNRG